jgi:hypothetical protein
MTFKNDIEEIISTLSSKFQENELSYLALTSKIELPLRDKISFGLHKKYADKYLVCREWKSRESNSSDRIDLAIINKSNSKVLCLIEFKAQSVVALQKGYTRYLAEDLIKIRDIAQDDSVELYYIYFNNKITSELSIDSLYNNSIKYFKGLNKNINKKRGSAENCKLHWEEHLKEVSLPNVKSTHLSINAGKYYNYPVTIETFIYGPITKSEITDLM